MIDFMLGDFLLILQISSINIAYPLINFEKISNPQNFFRGSKFSEYLFGSNVTLNFIKMIFS